MVDVQKDMGDKGMGLIGNGWDRLIRQDDLADALEWSRKKRNKALVYPTEENVLNAFQLCPPEDTFVVIVGQDPYPGTDKDGVPHAHGLAFSSESKVSIPGSLQNVFKELERTYGVLRTNPNLEDWARQGVLLLNMSLTVEAGKPGSHRGRYWDRVTINAIRFLTAKCSNIVFMLWGNDAQTIIPWIHASNPHIVLRAVHPSPMSAHKGFLGCEHFRKANEYLVGVTGVSQSNRVPRIIDWIGKG